MKDTAILVFGDSIAYGAWDEEGGWAQRMRKFLEKKISDSNSYYPVYILGIDADYTESLLKRIEKEIEPRLMEGESIILFSVGINDSCFIKSNNHFLTTKKKFEKNIHELIKISKHFSSKIIFVGLTPVEESKTNPISWSKSGKSYRNEYIESYNKMLRDVCRNKVHFVEIFDRWTKLDYNKLLDDGLHPNSEGHKKIFEAVRDYLVKNKII